MSAGENWGLAAVKNMMDLCFSGTSAQEKIELFFFSNDYTPNVAVVDADLTEIGTASGLGRVELLKAQFSRANSFVGTSVTVFTMYNGTSGLDFTAAEDTTSYGYAVRGQSSRDIYYVKNFGRHAFEAGDPYTIQTLQFQMEL